MDDLQTHALQAVPTTFGAKLASYLAELARHHERLACARSWAGVVSLFGAGGTSTAYGDRAAALRRRVAELLGLASTEIPWHVETLAPHLPEDLRPAIDAELTPDSYLSRPRATVAAALAAWSGTTA